VASNDQRDNPQDSDLPGAPPAPGRMIASRFELRRWLGCSAGVKTALGLDSATGGSVIVKLIPLASVHPGALMQLEYEAVHLQSLRSPSVAQALYVGREDADLALVFDHINGTSLDTCLERPLNLDESLSIGRSLFSALRDMHGHRLLHRGVRPRNIIVDRANSFAKAILVDFAPPPALRLEETTLDQRSLAAALYLSPEQAGAIDHEVCEASDLYSAGATLFHCLAGRPPFVGDSISAVLFEHMTACVPELRTLGVAAPRALEDVLQRLLRKDPRDRYQSADAVLADLEAIAAAVQRGDEHPQIVIGASDVRQTLADPAFVGRAAELAAVDRQLELTAKGAAGTISLEGESGGGKTTLLTEITYRAGCRRFRTFWGQGANDVARQPFSMLQGVADAFLAAAKAEPRYAAEVAARLADDAPAVVAALPTLAPVLSSVQLHESTPEPPGEVRTLRALASFLAALGSAERPAFIVLDDCQWADDLTCRLIRRWASTAEDEAGARHVLLVAAFRGEEVGDDHLLRRITAIQQLKLSPFSDDETRRLIESIAGQLPDNVIAAVVNLAEGSPFMASAVLRGFVESGALVREANQWRVDSSKIDDIQSSSQAAEFLARRLELLPPDVLGLLSTGAVLGKEFEVNVAAQLAVQSAGQAIGALDTARSRRLVWIRADGGRCVFVHDKIRAALLDRQSKTDLQSLHCRAADYLETLAPDRAAEIAYHFDAAGHSFQALPYALQAAQQSRAQNALESAEQQYLIAERGARESTSATRFDVAQGLGEVLMHRGRYEDAGKKFAEASSWADGTLAQAMILGKRGELSHIRGDMEHAIEHIEAALSLLKMAPPRWKVIRLLSLSWQGIVLVLHTLFPHRFVHRFRRLPSEKERLILRLLSHLAHGYWYCRSRTEVMWAHLHGFNLAERYLPTPELAQCYAEHAPGLTLVGWLTRAIKYAEKSLQLRREFGDLAGQGQSLHYYGVVLYTDSQYAKCIERCRDAIRFLDHTGDFWQVHIARYQIAASLYRLGDLAGALEECRLNHRSGIELGDAQASGIILDIWARAAGGALPPQLLSHELERPRHDAQGRAQVLFAAGIVALSGGNAEKAVEFFEASVKVSEDARIRNAYTLPIWAWLATALRQQAARLRSQSARRRTQLLRKAEKIARRAIRLSWLCHNDLPHAYREMGLILGMRGYSWRAKRYLRKSVKIAEKHQARYERAQTLLAFADLGDELGWPRSAASRVEAQAILGELHAYADAQTLDSQGRATASLSLADRFDGVLDWGRRIASALSPSLIFEEARTAALRLLRAEHCVVLQTRETNGLRTFTPVAGEIPGTASEDRLTDALEAGKAIAFEEDAAKRSGAAASGKRSALCVPLYVRGSAVALLYVTHERIRKLFGNDEERLADYIAAIAGAALENSEGFAQLQELNLTLEKRVEDRTAAVEARSRELARSNQELERLTQKLLEAQGELTVAKQAAEAANEAKSRFLATMSHEIRTPMNSIIGMTELTLNSKLATRERSNLTTVNDSAKSLLRLLNDILDFSKIESGRMELETVPMSVRDVVEDACHLLSLTAAGKGLELVCHVAPNVPECVMGDPSRIRQIIINLIGNAIKFTSQGGVFVRVHQLSGAGEKALLHFAVQDSGIGIPADKQDCIFEAFKQSDSSITRQYGGTGLGLAICAQFIALMEGRIWVESELGHGSTFQFEVPFTTVEDKTVAPRPKFFEAHRALVVSANRLTRISKRGRLKLLGFQVLALDPSNNQFANRLRDLNAKKRYDLAIVDIPAASDDLQLLTAVRQQQPSLPVIALLPPGKADLVEKCQELGATQCLTKSVRHRDLEAALRESLGLSTDAASRTPPADAGPLRKLRVLVADDSPVNLEVAAGLLRLRGHEVQIANNGREALDLWKTEPFDIILMDVEMHEMDGLTATRAIRKEEQSLGRRTPILALTAHSIAAAEERCLHAGMDGCIAKPFQPEELFRIIESTCGSAAAETISCSG
jgi:signal transduction histidine kinase/CheY-like chemotaxis protein/tetratricopeptide (TPR) repeat protein